MSISQNTKKNEILLNRKFHFIEKLLKRFRIGQLLAFSFSFVIFAGSILLALPISNRISYISYINHLFVSASAVCVTGLSPLVIANQYTLFGKIIMICLMQIGGLGLMTFIAMIVMLRHKRMNLAETRIFASASGKTDFYDVPGFIRKIILYTLFFEGVGFLFLCKPMIRDFGILPGLFNALFLSVSAFTNAGFDCLGDQSLSGYATDLLVCIPIMSLIVVGGLGFVVWFELK